MGLFGNKNKESASCCCGNVTPKNMAQASAEKSTTGIKVLGSGCARCIALENAVSAAMRELGIDTPIEHVTDFAKIAAYGVMSTPALVIDGKVVSFGKVLTSEEAKEIIQKNRA